MVLGGFSFPQGDPLARELGLPDNLVGNALPIPPFEKDCLPPRLLSTPLTDRSERPGGVLRATKWKDPMLARKFGVGMRCMNGVSLLESVSVESHEWGRDSELLTNNMYRVCS